MRRRGALSAEILRCLDDADAEVGLPNSICENASRRGRIAIGEPAGKSETRVVGVWRQRMEERGYAGGNFFAGFEPVTALEHVCGARFIARAAAFVGHERERRRA